MSDDRIVDAHVHLWRTPEQERAALPLPGRRERDRWGTPAAALRELERSGIDRLVFLNVLPTVEMAAAALARLPADAPPAARDAARSRVDAELVERVRRQNDWACALGAEEPRLVPVVGVQPLLGAEGMADEARRGHARGARGVKLQPGMNAFDPADRILYPLYETCASLGLPVVSDTGTYGAPAPGGGCYGEPVRFAPVLRDFPSLRLVMCHFASAFWDERVALAARHPNLLFDLAGGFASAELAARDGGRALPEADAARVLRTVGLERFLWGSDGPSVMPGPYLEQVLRLALTGDEHRLVLSENARRVYAL